MKIYTQGYLENCWFPKDQSGGDGVEISVQRDQVLIHRENSGDFLEFTFEEWDELIEFVRKELVDYADINS